MMTAALAITITLSWGLGGALEVSAPPGCVDPVEVGAAIDEIGGIDVAEVVRVSVTPNTDEYTLVVDIALAQAEPLHREVPLRPRECQDVADLVAVLVQAQRRAALEARLLAAENKANNASKGEDDAGAGVPPPKPALPAMDPRTRGVTYPGTEARAYEPDFSACEGPMACAGLRVGVGVGAAYPFGGRGALDTGWDLTPNVTAIGLVDAMAGSDTRAGANVGLAYRTTIEDVVEFSVRGLIGGGGGTRTITPTGLEDAQCVPDDSGNPVPQIETLKGSTVLTNWYVAPTVAVRGRVGYVFAEVGTTWHLNLDDAPAAYVAIGFAPVGSM